MGILSHKLFLKGFSENKVFFIQRRQLILTDNGSQSTGIAYLGVAGKELVGYSLMIGSGKALADTVLHQTGQAGQYVNGRIDGLSI